MTRYWLPAAPHTQGGGQAPQTQPVVLDGFRRDEDTIGAGAKRVEGGGRGRTGEIAVAQLGRGRDLARGDGVEILQVRTDVGEGVSHRGRRVNAGNVGNGVERGGGELTIRRGGDDDIAA